MKNCKLVIAFALSVFFISGCAGTGGYSTERQISKTEFSIDKDIAFYVAKDKSIVNQEGDNFKGLRTACSDDIENMTITCGREIGSSSTSYVFDVSSIDKGDFFELLLKPKHKETNRAPFISNPPPNYTIEQMLKNIKGEVTISVASEYFSPYNEETMKANIERIFYKTNVTSAYNPYLNKSYSSEYVNRNDGSISLFLTKISPYKSGSRAEALYTIEMSESVFSSPTESKNLIKYLQNDIKMAIEEG